MIRFNIHQPIFNEICRKYENLNHLVLKGAGTGSYFDNDEFPFKISKLETTMITFHWYVGIKSARVNFFDIQISKVNKKHMFSKCFF